MQAIFLLLLSLCFTSTKRKKDLQALKESLFISGRLLDLEKNETFKNKVAILTAKAKNDKERMATLEKSLQVEKDFCRLKDKQIGDLELKLLTVQATKVQDFKDSNEYSDELCKYYMEGFDLLVKWMAKHHPSLDLSGLAVDDVEKELMSDHPSEATAKNVTEGATDIAEVIQEAAITTLADPVLE